MKIKKCQLAYFAGYFDGEGSIGITKIKERGRIRYRIQTSIGTSNNLSLLEIYKYFGGSIQCRKPRGVSKLHSWQLVMSCKKAAYFLRKIYPYCLIKKTPIEIALKFADQIRKERGGGFKPLTEGEINKRKNFKELIETANKNNFTGPN